MNSGKVIGFVIIFGVIVGGVYFIYHDSQAQAAAVDSVQEAGITADEAREFQEQYGDSFIFPWGDAIDYDSKEIQQFAKFWEKNPQAADKVLKTDAVSQSAAESALNGDYDGDGVRNSKDPYPLTVDPIFEESTDLGLSEELALKMGQEISAENAKYLLQGLENISRGDREKVVEEIIQDGKLSDVESYAFSSLDKVTRERIQDVRSLAGDYGLEETKNLVEKHNDLKEENGDLATKYLDAVVKLKGNAAKAADRLNKLASHYSEGEIYSRVLEDGKITPEEMGEVEFGIKRAEEEDRLSLDVVFNADDDPIPTYFEMKHSQRNGGLYDPTETNDVYLFNFSAVKNPYQNDFQRDVTDKFVKELGVPRGNIVQVIENFHTSENEATWESFKETIDDLAPRVDGKDFVYSILHSHGWKVGPELPYGNPISFPKVGEELEGLNDARANFRYYSACGAGHAQDEPSWKGGGVVLATPSRGGTSTDHLESVYGSAFGDPSIAHRERMENEVEMTLDILKEQGKEPPYSVKELSETAYESIERWGEKHNTDPPYDPELSNPGLADKIFINWNDQAGPEYMD